MTKTQKTLRVATIQQQNSADVKDNIARLSQGIEAAAKQGAELIVLQELHNSLYFCQAEQTEIFDLAEAIPGPSTEHFGKLAKSLKLVIVSSLFERRAPGLYHNTAVVLDSDGSIAGKYRKMHIPDDPGYYEKFYFTPGDLGFEPIQTSVGKLGVLVCWDQWYPEAARLMAMRGADLLVYPTAIGWDPGDTQEEHARQRDAWITIQRSHAIANGLPVVSVNRVGFEAGVNAEDRGSQFWGSSFIAGAQGEILYMASDNEPEINIHLLNLSRAEQVRRIWPFFRDRRIDSYQGLTERYLDKE